MTELFDYLLVGKGISITKRSVNTFSVHHFLFISYRYSILLKKKKNIEKKGFLDPKHKLVFRCFQNRNFV